MAAQPNVMVTPLLCVNNVTFIVVPLRKRVGVITRLPILSEVGDSVREAWHRVTNVIGHYNLLNH